MRNDDYGTILASGIGCSIFGDQAAGPARRCATENTEMWKSAHNARRSLCPLWLNVQLCLAERLLRPVRKDAGWADSGGSGMEVERVPETIVALYAALADAEVALLALQDAGVPYPDIRMTAHTPGDLEGAQLAGASAPERFWSLAVLLDPKWHDKALEGLGAQPPI